MLTQLISLPQLSHTLSLPPHLNYREGDLLNLLSHPPTTLLSSFLDNTSWRNRPHRAAAELASQPYQYQQDRKQEAEAKRVAEAVEIRELLCKHGAKTLKQLLPYCTLSYEMRRLRIRAQQLVKEGKIVALEREGQYFRYKATEQDFAKFLLKGTLK